MFAEQKDIVNWEQLLDHLAERDFAVVDSAFEAILLESLKDRLDQLWQEDELEKAGIGTLGQYQIQEGIRGDYIQWLESGKHPAEEAFIQLMEEWRLLFNRGLFLNLESAEFHFAIYPEGSFYKRHLDQFKERNNRIITFILYLNPNWKAGDGGELRIYKGEEHLDIEPIYGRIVVFKSAALEHEVLPTQVKRRSLTGWFLYRPEGLSFLG
ncbi:MAG: 2OG-Fe(II) oxygenase [Bacteroidetes bacterium]|nr:MAG: 2OG-Fe(II) oxygenase [Bacteroidota bacterium]